MFATIRRSRPEPTLVYLKTRHSFAVQLCIASTLFLVGVWLCAAQYRALAAGLPERSYNSIPCAKASARQAPQPPRPTVLQPGLEMTAEPTQVYRVRGNNAEQIRAQLAHCSPIPSFSAYTSYVIDARYRYYAGVNGQCSISAATVRLRISQMLPQWQSSATTSAKTMQQWRAYLTHLTTHENGHTALDIQYARQLATILQRFNAPTCDDAKQLITLLINTELGKLNAANDRYDAQTNHGATQGAILR
jgi:predicted secreted Zn-dependent protease